MDVNDFFICLVEAWVEIIMQKMGGTNLTLRRGPRSIVDSILASLPAALDTKPSISNFFRENFEVAEVN